MLHRLPFRREEPIFKVHLRCPDRLITEDKIVVHDCDVEEWATRELSLEFYHFVYIRIRLILEVVVTIIELFLAQLNQQIRIREAAIVAGGQTIRRNDVKPHEHLRWRQQHPLQYIIALQIG